MIFRVAHSDTSDDSQCKGKTFFSIPMASVMFLYFSVQEEGIFEQTNASVICVHFSQLVDHLCNIGMHLITLP
jgi:hypothetical protein